MNVFDSNRTRRNELSVHPSMVTTSPYIPGTQLSVEVDGGPPQNLQLAKLAEQIAKANCTFSNSDGAKWKMVQISRNVMEVNYQLTRL